MEKVSLINILKPKMGNGLNNHLRTWFPLSYSFIQKGIALKSELIIGKTRYKKGSLENFNSTSWANIGGTVDIAFHNNERSDSVLSEEFKESFLKDVNEIFKDFVVFFELKDMNIYQVYFSDEEYETISDLCLDDNFKKLEIKDFIESLFGLEVSLYYQNNNV